MSSKQEHCGPYPLIRGLLSLLKSSLNRTLRWWQNILSWKSTLTEGLKLFLVVAMAVVVDMKENKGFRNLGVRENNGTFFLLCPSFFLFAQPSLVLELKPLAEKGKRWWVTCYSSSPLGQTGRPSPTHKIEVGGSIRMRSRR